MKNKQVLVTGGGGFLGKAIVRKLVAQDAAVTSFSRHFYPELEKMGVCQVQGDLVNPDDLFPAVEGHDIVFHVAAKPGIWGPYDTYYQVNVVGTRNVLDACFHHRVDRLIYTSSPSVVFDGSDMEGVDESVPYPETFHAPYPETKALAEQAVRKAGLKGLKTICLRPHLIWGPEDNHLVPGILSRADKLRIVGRSDDRVDTIYVDNAADAHILAARKLAENPELSGNVYFISQDEPVSKWEMANGFLAAAGLPPIDGRISEKGAVLAATLLEFFYKLFGIEKEPPLTVFAARELATSHWFDISRAKKDLGYVPQISIKEGLIRLQHWLQTVSERHEK